MKKLTLILTFLLLWTVVCGPSNVQADIPHLISHQGRLTNTAGAPVPNGTYSVTFRLYTAEAGGSPLWTETHSVTASDGIFEVLMGSNTSLDLPFDTQYYLGIQVGSDPEMTPRQQLASSGYAYRAKMADDAAKVGGIEASATPEANKLLALDENGKLPVAALKNYDSGWFAVSYNSAYTKTHDFGTQKVIWQLLFATDTSGSNCQVVTIIQEQGSHVRGGYLDEITTTQITARTGGTHVARTYSPGVTLYSSGYYRIIGLALE